MGNLCGSSKENIHFRVKEFNDLKRLVPMVKLSPSALVEDEMKRQQNLSSLLSLLSHLPQSTKDSWLMESTREDVKMTKLLLSAKANPNCEDEEGYTPLTCWINSTTMKHYKVLIDAKADVNKKHERNGCSALHFVVAWRNEESNDFLRILLESRADVNVMHYGETALMISSRRGYLGHVKTLLNFKASPKVREVNEPNALEMAMPIRDRYVQICHLLQECPRKRMIKVLSRSLPLPVSGGHYLLHDGVCVFSGD